MSLTALRRRLVPALLAATAMAWFGTPAPLAQESGPQPKVMLVLDASRSMWGQIEGVNKIVSARNVIGAMAKEYEGKAGLGLVAYGHRQSSGCGDIEVVFKPEDRAADEFIKTVNGITPKGSTPIAASLAKAAEAAGYTERQASLILIADGLDNCNANPCDMASELKQKGKDLTIHAIAFNKTIDDKLAGLSCIAEKTGGTFFTATNESELGESVKAAFEIAVTPPVKKVAAAPQPASDAAPAAPAPAAAAPEPAPEAMPKSDPLTTATVAQGSETGQPAAASDQAPPQQAEDGAGDAVPVTLSARTVEGGSIIKSGLVWWVYKNARTKDGKYELIDTFRDATPTAALPPGSYRIAAAYGKVNLIKDIDVQRGQALQETFILNAGGLRLGAVTHDGKSIPPNSVRYDLYADETETDQFGNRKLILRDARPGVVLRLNGGAYHVVSTYGDSNAIVRADVAVEPGRLTDATINHSAAKITFKLVTQPGGEALADTQWNILTPGGDIVKESAGALPTHILASGNYSVLARYQGKNYTRDFTVEPGEVKQIEVVIQ